MENDCFLLEPHPLVVTVWQGAPLCQKWECYAVDDMVYLVVDRFMDLSRAMGDNPNVALCTPNACVYGKAQDLGSPLQPENAERMRKIQAIAVTRYPYRPLQIDPTTVLFGISVRK